ncbi:MAG: hypothetical protein QM786_11500 [Breznakibacter sp.]
MFAGFMGSIRIWAMVLFLTLMNVSCTGGQSDNKTTGLLQKIESVIEGETPDAYTVENTMLIMPRYPAPGDTIRILGTGGRNICKAKIEVRGPSGQMEAVAGQTGGELPCWRIDEFVVTDKGDYKATLQIDGKEVRGESFAVAPRGTIPGKGVVWKTERGWDSRMETLYSAWVNTLFHGCDEQSSWPALNEVTQSRPRNFLYNHLSLGEDDPASKIKVVMEPDCADNPFFLRAYFAWKLGLPFGYHVCDRGYLGKNPQTGQWITNGTMSSKAHPVLAFNSFLRNVMNGVHSGTGRTALENGNSDYYPVALDRASLRPGTVFADPYGHTFIVVSWREQTRKHPGQLLAVDAQPDGTVAIKRFWKGNFLFNTSGVVGEPGFKVFRPIVSDNGKLQLVGNDELTKTAGFVPFSLQQKGMEAEAFYHAMERLINPRPLDPEDALGDLIGALHEQLMVRVKSVANGEAYLQANPGTVVPMPSNANGIFLAGGMWEDFSTPNRDLRLLIAMDAVLGFPQRVSDYPQDFGFDDPAAAKEMGQKLRSILNKRAGELKISYTRTDGSFQELTMADLLQRRSAFEMAYNPNDGVEIRWGAPEGSAERSTCRRHAPPYQQQVMQAVRKWFEQRLHPPT